MENRWRCSGRYCENLAGPSRPAVPVNKGFFSNDLTEDAQRIDFDSNRLFVESYRERRVQAPFKSLAGGNDLSSDTSTS